MYRTKGWAYETPIYQRVVAQQGFDPMVQRGGRELGRLIAQGIRSGKLGHNFARSLGRLR